MSPTIDENSIYMYTLKYIMGRGEVEGVGEQLATVKAMTGGAVPVVPSLKYKTWNHIDNSLG